MQQLKPWPFQCPEPGIYFGMDFEQYLSIPCLSSSTLKQLLMSGGDGSDGVIGAADFWYRCSWLNPEGGEITPESKAKIDGKAYHKRILEGREAFYSEYALAYEPDPTLTDVLHTTTDMTEFLKQHGAKGYSGKTKPFLIEMCRDADPNVKIGELLKTEYEAQYQGKQFVSAATIREIERAAINIEHHKELQPFFAGGYPEVSVIWEDEHLGVMLKARFDYLKVGPPVDLKTFANQLQKEISKAINHSIAQFKYPIQGSLYIRANQIGKNFVREGRVFMADHVDPKWLSKYASTDCDEFWWLFQQKGVAPIAKGRVFTAKEALFETGVVQIDQAAKRFIANYNHYGPDVPWIDQERPRIVHKDDLPSFTWDL